jgi:TetR/AcrR family hemagglutinin/protease transcriptional regulator
LTPRVQIGTIPSVVRAATPRYPISPGVSRSLTVPARAARTRLPPDRRRAQLLQCAIAAFAEHGVARATHAHVADRAEVSVSAVHSYFRTREDLVAATLGAVETELMDIVLATDIENVEVEEALAAMVHGFDHAARTNPEAIKVWLDWSTGFRDDVWPRYLVMQERIHAAVRRVLARGKRQGILAKGLNVTAAARLFVGGGHTIALMRLGGANRREIAILIDHLIKSICSIGLAHRDWSRDIGPS